MNSFFRSLLGPDKAINSRRKKHAHTRARTIRQLSAIGLEHLENRLLLTGILGIGVTADVSTVTHGGTVNYSYDVTYTGDAGVTEADGSSITVNDDTCSPVNPNLNGSFNTGDTDQDGNLDEGETWEYSCVLTVPAHSDSEADPIANIVTVTGDDVNGDPATSDSDSASVDIEHDAGTLSIVKAANAPSVAHGGTITYTFDVSYAVGADGSPAGNIVVTDAECNAGTLSGPTGDTNSNGLLNDGETWRYTCSRTVSLAHAAGEEDPIANTATVNGTDFDGDALTTAVSNTVSVNVTHTAGTLTITKGANVTSVSHGGSITYTFDVRHTAGADGSPAQNIVVTDAKCDTGTLGGPTGDNGNGLLDAGETWRYTCTQAVATSHSQGEEDPIAGTATVDGDDLDGDALAAVTSNSVSVNIIHSQGTLNITKSANRTTVPHGGTVVYTFNVTYAPGDDGSPAQNIVVSDAGCTSAPTMTGGDTNSDMRLDSTETWTFTCSFTVPTSHGSGETDPITNTATVSGQDFDGDALPNDTSNTVSVDLVHSAISGRKFLDLDADGVQDPDEMALRGWTINLFRDSNSNSTFDQGTDTLVATQVTDFAGNYNFTDLVAGTYFVREVVRVGFTQTSPARDLTIVGDDSQTGQDFANHLQGSALIPDPRTAGDTALLVVGTQSSDKITIGRDRRTTSTTVTLNGRRIGFYNPNGSIIVYGLGGNDQISAHADITRPMIVHGGDGNDNIAGGASHDVLVGNDGRDTLHGKIGRDVLIGGTGQDQLSGNGGEDVLVAGSTDFDGRIEALAAILAEWKSNRSYTERVSNLRNGTAGTRLNGDFFLDGTTTHDDGAADALTGGADLDWFLAQQTGTAADRLNDLITNELVDAL
jgi:hypothetical protein